MSKDLGVCLYCDKTIPDGIPEHAVQFRYEIPGTDRAPSILMAETCEECSKLADDPKLFPVIEAILNAKIIRLANPDLEFTP